MYAYFHRIVDNRIKSKISAPMLPDTYDDKGLINEMNRIHKELPGWVSDGYGVSEAAKNDAS